MKKMLKIVAAFLFVCYFAIINSSNYYAITIAELQATATNLTYGTAVADAVEYEDDVNWYKFTVSDTGYFQLSLSFTNNSNVDDIGFGWKIKIYSATDLANEIREFSSVKSNLTTAKMSLPKGDYYVSVEDQHSSFPTKGCEYAIKAIYGVDSHWEKEPNNENKDATVINVNEEYKAVHTNTEDIDWYKFTTNKDGKISVSFTIGAETDIDNIGWGWHFEIYDSNFVLLKKYSSIERNFTTVELPFSKGTYYVKVEMQHSSFPCTDCVYGIKINHKTPVRWESEYNDTNVQADVIKVNEVWNGTLYHDEDVDWYKVKTTKTGYFQVELGVPSTVDKDAVSWGWHMTVYDKNFNEIKVIKSITKTTKTVLLPYGKETFYIKIEAQHSGFAPRDCHYTVKVINKTASNFESENNDIKAKADKITIGKTYNGVTQIAEDEDWYKFTISKTGTVKIDLKKHSSASKEDISWGWSFIIYDKNNEELIKVSNIKSTGTATLDLKKGTYYVLVEAQHTSFAPDECRYTISTKYSQTPATSKITSISSKSKKVTLKWKKSSNATGYYVYRSTEKDGEYTKIATVKGASKTSYKDSKGLKKGRTYYYRIVAYKTTDKVIAKAKAGNTKSVKVK